MKKIWMLLSTVLAISAVIVACGGGGGGGSSYVGAGATGTPRFAYVTNHINVR